MNKILLNFILSLIVATTSILYARTGARLLIIAPDQFVPHLQPLADWKSKKGIKAIIAPLSVTGNSASQIKNYILNAYNNWEIRPEYILLAGHGNIIPYSGYSDDYYGDISGNYRIELSVGRFPVTSVAQLENIINKTINYERNPYLIDTLWLRKGMTIVREDGSGYPPSTYPDSYYWSNARYCHRVWRHNGEYVLIDSLSKNLGHSSTNIINGINDGRAYIIFRGQSVNNWWSPFSIDPNQCNNGYKLPVVVSGTCATMSISNTGYLGDQFINAGTASIPKGAVGYFGSTQTASGSGLALQRGTVATGFFKALFEEKTYILGDACKRAKLLLDSLQPPGFSQVRYQEWELFGDPSLQLWTTTPKRLTVIHDTIIPYTQNSLSVTVRGPNGEGIYNALVCLRMDLSVYIWDYTNFQGQVTMPITAESAGIMEITVTAPNYYPYEGQIRLIPENTPNLYYFSSIINDQLGNNDGKINPGEIINLRVLLKNEGTQPAQEVYAILSAPPSQVTINDSIAYFGTINPGQNVSSLDTFQFIVNHNIRHGTGINFNLHIFDNQNHSWNRQFILPVYAGKIILSSLILADSPPGGNNNNLIGPLEGAKIFVQLTNIGENLTQVRGLLRSENPYIAITESLSYFGNIAFNGSAYNNSNPFTIQASPNLPRNYNLQAKILITAQGGSYTYFDTLITNFNSEAGSTQEPTGPDNYGYWCYDDTDTSSGRAPIYSWFEIGPGGPGSIIQEITNHDAQVTTFSLPFTFRYYGQIYDSISVCSNGFLAMGRTSYRFGNNPYPIPDTSGPQAMIAPLWCDLDPSLEGDIYKYYDLQNHRFIVEFYNVALYGQNTNCQTFQVLLYDPNHYQTPTGDGEIQFNYQTINPALPVTVGIEDPTQMIGIQYMRNNTYAPTTAPLNTGRAVRFTTLPPINLQSPWLYLVRSYFNDSISGNNNGIPNLNEVIYFAVKLYNNSSNLAQNVTVKLHSTDGAVMLTDSISYLGNIAACDTSNNLSDPFIFQVINIPTDSVLNFSLEINALNYSTFQYIRIPVRLYQAITEVEYMNTLMPHLEIAPNPFSDRVEIRYFIPTPSNFELKIYNVLGEVVKTLVHKSQQPNDYRIWWDRTDNYGNLVPRGIYFCSLQYKNIVQNKKLIVY
jgi:hypothetical protein